MPTMTSDDFHRSKQEICAHSRKSPHVGQVLDKTDTVLSAGPIDSQSLVWICSAHGGAIGRNATPPLPGEMDDGFWSRHRPAFCCPIDRIGQAATAEGKRLTKKIAVAGMENYDLSFADSTVGIFIALHIFYPDEGALAESTPTHKMFDVDDPCVPHEISDVDPICRGFSAADITKFFLKFS
jgi:hypothetical protein